MAVGLMGRAAGSVESGKNAPAQAAASRFAPELKNTAMAIPEDFKKAPLIHGIDASDNMHFWNRRVPGLMITDGASLRNPNYLTTADTLESLDLDFMLEVIHDGIADLRRAVVPGDSGSMKARGILRGLLTAAILTMSGSGLFAQAGDSWQALTVKHFAPRYGAAAAVFQDRVFLIGGGLDYGEGIPTLNDVWSSADGASWDLVVADPPFPPRSGGTALVFQGRLWLFGGENDDSYMDWGGGLHDLWASADGRTWEEVKPPFSVIEDAWVRGFLFKGAFILTMHLKDGTVRFFRSADGRSWTEAGTAKMAGISLFWEYGGNVWAMGGSLVGKESGRTLWRSADGISWQKASEKFLPAFEAAPVSLRGRLLGPERGRFWESTDGWNWKQVASAAGNMWIGDPATIPGGDKRYPKQAFAFLSFRDLAWLLGGRMLQARDSPGVSSGIDVASSEVWSSADGLSWTRKAGLEAPSGSAGFLPASCMPARAGHALVAFRGALYLTGGMYGYDFFSDCWKSTDGRTWKALTPVAAVDAYHDFGGSRSSPGLFSARKNHAMAVFQDRIWVAAGRVKGGSRDADPFTSDVWSSADGVTWRREVEKAPFPPREGHGLVVHGGRLILYGGIGWNVGKKAPEALGDVWASADGVAWRKLEQASEGLPPGGFFGGASFQGRLWWAGGSFDKEGKWYSTRGVFSSEDGVNWRADASLPAPWESGACLAAGSRLILLGGYSNGRANLAWTSADGTSWTALEPVRRFDPSYGAAAAVLGESILYTGGLPDRDGPPLGVAWSLPVAALGGR